MSIQLNARAEIAELNARFAWALDLHEWDALREVLTEDVHYVGAGGELRGVDQVISSFRSRAPGRTTRHGLGNLSLREGPGDAILGRSSWHTFASNVWPVDDVPLYLVADFADVYAVSAGRWRIAERVITPVFRRATLAPTSIQTGVEHE